MNWPCWRGNDIILESISTKTFPWQLFVSKNCVCVFVVFFGENFEQKIQPALVAKESL